MYIFGSTYMIIIILSLIILVMGLMGLYFLRKSERTVREVAVKSFCGIGKIEYDYEKARAVRKNRGVVYISIALENMERLYSESMAFRMHEQIKKILLLHFGVNMDGEIALYETGNFVALNNLKENEIEQYIDRSFYEINEVLIKYSVVNVVRVNFGYYCASSTEVSFETALGRAKQACSMAEDKSLLYCGWNNLNGKEFERKIKIENNIKKEIDNNKFFLEYQPILEAETDKIIGAEVLARLNSSTEGILTPGDFLKAVNNVGLNEKFDYYIFDKNCKWISNDKENRNKYVYTINFSRFTLCDQNFAEDIISIVEKYNVDYSSIAIEILEDKDLNENETSIMKKNLSLLKEKGSLILLDDFGKGYASFGDLTELDIDIVKIDKSITQSATSPNGFLILKNIIRTAHDLGFKTLCEGIETEEHKKIAVEAECDMLQGYYFYRPMAITQLEKLFEEQQGDFYVIGDNSCV